MKDDAGKEEVGKGAFGTDVVEIDFVLRVALDAQAGREDERPGVKTYLSLIHNLGIWNVHEGNRGFEQLKRLLILIIQELN